MKDEARALVVHFPEQTHWDYGRTKPIECLTRDVFADILNEVGFVRENVGGLGTKLVDRLGHQAQTCLFDLLK